MDAYRAVVDKRDQRAFLPRAIPDESLRRILQAARMTGSSKNLEPNRLIVVRDHARLERMGSWQRINAWVAGAAVVIVIAQTERHDFDAGRCAQNMMIAAWNEGIGSCPAHLPETELARMLGIPDGLSVNRVIAFGYIDPARTAPPRAVARTRLPVEALVSWETWQESPRSESS